VDEVMIDVDQRSEWSGR